MKKLTSKEVNRRTLESSNGVVMLDESTYVNSYTKATFIDKDFGEWQSWPRNVYALFNSHPTRALEAVTGVPKISVEEVNDRVFRVHGNTIKMDPSTYAGIHTPCVFIDRDFGEWRASPGNVINGHGHKKRGYLLLSNIQTFTAEKIQEQLDVLYGDMVTLKKETYLNTYTKAIFIDKDFGEWDAIPNSVLSGHLCYKRGSIKRQETNKQRYGVPFILQNNEIALKQQKSNLKNTAKIHWKTGEELVCQASYEPKVVNYLNFNKIEYEWQPKTFEMPNGKTYRPDLFLINENKWIEIKGYMRPHSQLKWDWFKTQFPDAELWDKKKLQEMGIL